jgi:hypothetical protein
LKKQTHWFPQGQGEVQLPEMLRSEGVFDCNGADLANTYHFHRMVHVALLHCCARNLLMTGYRPPSRLQDRPKACHRRCIQPEHLAAELANRGTEVVLNRFLAQ